ncbi:MAG: putative peptidoglycan glycosyltransferase FtsW [Candidatus Bipolaricaulota bacterium]
MDRLQGKILVVSVFLLWTGLLFVYSASFPLSVRAYGHPFGYLERQVLGAVVGMLALGVLWRVDYHRWAQVDDILLVGVFFLAALTLVPGIPGGGRWLGLGPATLQPTELGKVALVLYMGGSLARRGEEIKHFRAGIVPYLCVLAAFGVVLVLQPDLGMLLLYACMAGFLLWAGGARLSHLLAVGAGSLPVLAGLMAAAPYRMGRLLAFLDPGGYQETYAYQVYQSLMAIGAGGVLGRGLGASRAKLFYLPEAHNDFVFAVVAEETGLLGAGIVVSLLAGLVFFGYQAARRAPDRLGALYALGATFALGFQMLLNLGVVVGALPVTGLTLPFLSYGGSSLAVTLALVGLILGVARQGLSREEARV